MIYIFFISLITLLGFILTVISRTITSMVDSILQAIYEIAPALVISIVAFIALIFIESVYETFTSGSAWNGIFLVILAVIAYNIFLYARAIIAELLYICIHYIILCLHFIFGNLGDFCEALYTNNISKLSEYIDLKIKIN